MNEQNGTSTLLVSPERFMSLMAGFPSGVAVVTAAQASGQLTGMTCSSVCSVSLKPPILLVCLRTGSRTLSVVTTRQAFSVNMLHDGASHVARRFAGGGDRFSETTWSMPGSAAGPHLTDDAHSIADCAVDRIEVVGDHAVVFGRVIFLTGQARRPLVYGLRRYISWPESTESC